MMASHRNRLRRIRLASIQLAGWSIYPFADDWVARHPDGIIIGTFRNKERAVAYAENEMVRAGLLQGRYFNGHR